MPLPPLPAADFGLPDPRTAELDDDGLLAAGGDLAPMRLLAAYANGIFPWFNSDADPILWWCPNPRAVLKPEAFQPNRSLAKVLRQQRFEIQLDSAFADVIQACAVSHRPGQGGTWITPEMRRAYVELHEAGFAHSVEAFRDNKLVGGLYGVSLGRMFFGESMFSHESDASKAAFAGLCRQLAEWRFELVDGQMMNPHLARLGFAPMARSRFLAELDANDLSFTRRGPWQLESSAGKPTAGAEEPLTRSDC